MRELEKIEEIRRIIDYDFLLNYIERSVNGLSKNPDEIDDDDTERFLSGLINHLKTNIEDHVVVVPLLHATLSKAVKARNFVLITERLPRESKIEDVARLARMSRKKAVAFASHTEKSRSPGFFNHVLLCVLVRNQTSYVHFSADRNAKFTIFAIRAFYHAYFEKLNSQIRFGPKIIDSRHFHPNTHLAIYSRDRWRNSHRPLSFSADCQFSLDWINETVFQDKLQEFLDHIVFPENYDALSSKFLNALIMLNKGLEQEEHHETSLALLLYVSAAESLLTEEDSEKRLRLMAILPRITFQNDISISTGAQIISELYSLRNSFVHGGQELRLNTLSERIPHNLNPLIVMTRYLSRLITDFPNFVVELGMNPKQGNPLNAWRTYVRNIFDRVIKGSFSDPQSRI